MSRMTTRVWTGGYTHATSEQLWGIAVRAGKTQATREAAREVNAMETTAEAEFEAACHRYRGQLMEMARVYSSGSEPTPTHIRLAERRLAPRTADSRDTVAITG